MPGLLIERAGPRAAHHRDKRRAKLHNSRTEQDLPPPQFWDNLSHIPLVKGALRELDRRNSTTQLPEQDPEASRPSPGDPQQLEAGQKHQDIKRFSRTGGPDLSDLRGYAYSPTESQALSERRGRGRRRSNMPRRGSTRGGRTSVSVLGKRGRNAAGEPPDSEYEPRASGRVCGRGGRQPRGRGRAEGAGTRQKSGTAARDKSTTSATTVTSTRSGPYHRDFTQHLLDHNIFPVDYESLDGKEPELPDNMGEIEAELGKIRALEPADDFRRLRTRYRQVSNEDDALNLLDTLQGDNMALLRSHVIRQKQKMSNLAPLTDGTIVPGNPDRAYGARATELDRSIRQDLEDIIVPTCDKDFIRPNFMVHVKSDRGDVTIARAQAAYDGALAARGMQALWDFGDGPGIASGIQRSGGDTGGGTAAPGGRSDSLTDPDPGREGSAGVARVARTITCTWTTGILKMYATYCEVNPDSGEEAISGNLEAELPKYVPSLIGSWIMTDKENQFREGLAAYRNGLDWAKKQRDIVIIRANTRVRAEKARRRRGEEEDSGEGHHADGEEQSEGEVTYELQNNLEEEDRSEEKDSSEEEDGGSNSIFARRRSQARGQDEEDQDSDPADGNIYQSLDSQRTVTTRSMSRNQLNGKRS